MSLKILIVEDEAVIAYNLKQSLHIRGYTVLPIASEADIAVSFAVKYAPDVILMDIMLKGSKTGIDAAREIFAKISIPIIFLTGNSHLLADTRFKTEDKYSILPKPPSESRLMKFISDAVPNSSPSLQVNPL